MELDAITGRLTWTPTASQFGANAVTLTVEDSRSATASQSFSLEVISQQSNQAPEILSTPRLGATLERCPWIQS